ncbi:MAG: hypothetical protein CVT92_10505 [Bacteroidetes bacterium HGW-Bacteroidetes-1]|jgi:hypothetical protein|nr:MAG: hypothetical protein CVT92_10505 [Bacteroidetes bacterium HGW-Bacteroidetes-1]
MTFCSACNKKLVNNFPNWKEKNPEKSFDDFKQLACVSEHEMNKIAVKPGSTTKGIKYWIGFSVAFALFYVIGHYGGETIVRFLKSEKTSKQVLQQEWIKETYGDFGLTVETPFKMTKTDLLIPDDVRQLIDKMDVYNYTSAKGFKVIINSIKYNPVIGEGNLKGAADGAINEMKIQRGVTDLKYVEESVSIKAIPGFIQRGSYKMDDIGIEFINTGFSEGLIFWQVLVAFQANDEVGRIAAGRVIQSIEINESNIVL